MTRIVQTVYEQRGAANPRSRGFIPGTDKRHYNYRIAHTPYNFSLAVYSTDSCGIPSPEGVRGRASGRSMENLPSRSEKIKNSWSYTYHPPHILIK
jgi:hypothetical protein